MVARSRWLILVLPILLTCTIESRPATAQQRAGPSDGIWIADASGELRRVRPSGGIRSAASGREAPAPRGVRVVVGVESFAHSASGAVAANQLATRRVIGATASIAGATGASILHPTTVEVELAPRSPLHDPRKPPRRVGFQARTQVLLEVPDPRRLGLLLDAAIGAGATYILSVDSGG